MKVLGQPEVREQSSDRGRLLPAIHRLQQRREHRASRRARAYGMTNSCITSTSETRSTPMLRL